MLNVKVKFYDGVKYNNIRGYEVVTGDRREQQRRV